MAWAVPPEMALQVLLLPGLLVWSLLGDLGLDSGQDEGPLSPGRTPFQPPAPPQCSLGPDRDISQCCRLCCCDCHQLSWYWVPQHLIGAWLAGDLQMRYYFVCGPLRGSVCWVISGRAQAPKGQYHRSCCELTAWDPRDLGCFLLWKAFEPTSPKRGERQ